MRPSSQPTRVATGGAARNESGSRGGGAGGGPRSGTGSRPRGRGTGCR
jgi:hypothetical protein